MGKIKFEHGIELERGEENEYVLRLRLPGIEVTPDPTGGHIKRAKREVLLAVRSLIDKAIKDEEASDKEKGAKSK